MKTELLRGVGEGRQAALQRAAELLLAGEVVAFPTETVYGLGALATSAEAIAKVFEAKGRPSDNPLIVHVASPDDFPDYAHTTDRVTRLATAFMPGPLTLVLRSRENIPANARAGLPTVAIRVPDHELAQDLLRLTGPLVAPSANRSGRPSPTRASHVLDDLDGKISAILDGGPCRVGIESTVLDLSHREPRILRPGLITRDDLAPFLGMTPEIVGPGAGDEGPASPGMKYRHYAPGIPVEVLVLTDLKEDEVGNLKFNFNPGERVRVLATDQVDRGRLKIEGVDVVRLDEGTLFSEFRRAEKEGIERIVIIAGPAELSEGLTNRLAKASSGE